MDKRLACRWNVRLLGICIILTCVGSMQGQEVTQSADGLWTYVQDKAGAGTQYWIRPQAYKTLALDLPGLRQRLAAAPLEDTPASAKPLEMVLPMPDGKFARFAVVESPIMEPGLAEEFPEIKTFLGQGLDDPTANVRFDYTPAGFHAQILAPTGAVYIDPLYKGDSRTYSTYYKRDYVPQNRQWTCYTQSEGVAIEDRYDTRKVLNNGTTLRKYRLANAATAEYTAFHGGTVALGQAAIVTSINRVSGVYENELAVRLILVTNNSSLVYTDAATDPYTNDDAGALLDENQSNVDSVIGSANYDVGHVFSTAGGGLAALGVVCSSGYKARGETGRGDPVGDPFDIDYVAHEMGHQFGGDHTFNSVTGNCNNNRVSSAAYEPGSGTTIQSYAGICGTDDLQPHSDAFFHEYSMRQILSYLSGTSCASSTATGNTPPTVDAGPNYYIPAGTPFYLQATGSDANGDTLTYDWEELDLGAAQTVTDPDNGASPIFRSWPASTSPIRYFPRFSDLLNNTLAVGEKLPTTTRAMHFVVTARDNRAGGGGIKTDDMYLYVRNTAGPFRVTYPNAAITLYNGNTHTVTWDVANTTASPISCSTVNVRLSTDGGWSYPYYLATGVSNTGSAVVSLPSVTTSTARIKVEAANNIFFDISDSNFTIMPAPIVAFAGGSPVIDDTPYNGNGNGRLDPGERNIELYLSVQNNGNYAVTSVVGTLTSLTPNVQVNSSVSAYPDMAVGAWATNSVPFNIWATTAFDCGETIHLRLNVSCNFGEQEVDFYIGTGSLGTVRTCVFDSISGADTAVVIPDNTGSYVDIPITVGRLARVGDVNFSIDGTSCDTTVPSTTVGIEHGAVGDLVMALVSPAGTQVTLANRPGPQPTGSAGKNFCNTLFDSDNSYPSIQTITTADAPNTGRWSPVQSLDAFIGQEGTGVWNFRIGDYGTGGRGKVRAFSLMIQPVICQAPLSLSIVSATSRKMHGSMAFDLDVLTAPAIEMRKGSVHQFIVNFTTPIAALGGLDPSDISVSAGTVSSPVIADNTLTFDVGGVPDNTRLTIGFPGIVDAFAEGTTDTLCVGLISGDCSKLGGGTSDGTVNIYDIVAIKGVFDQTISPTGGFPFRCDVSAVDATGPDGVINIYDLIAVKANIDRLIPANCP